MIYMEDATSYNRAYLAPRLRHFAQIQLCWTSDTLETLDEIAAVGRDKKIERILKLCYYIFERDSEL